MTMSISQRNNGIHRGHYIISPSKAVGRTVNIPPSVYLYWIVYCATALTLPAWIRSLRRV